MSLPLFLSSRLASIPRAVARRVRGAVCAQPLRLLPLPVIPVLVAPCFHPTSSCSRRRLWVPWWWCLAVLVSLCTPLSFRFRCPPPHTARCRRRRAIVDIIFPAPCPHCSPYRPQQAAAGRGVAGAVVIPRRPVRVLVLLLSSVLAPPSAPRAAARSSGGECRDVPVVLLSSLSLSCPFPVLIILVLILSTPHLHYAVVAGAGSRGHYLFRSSIGMEYRGNGCLPCEYPLLKHPSTFLGAC